jgi:hypothetical protein
MPGTLAMSEMTMKEWPDVPDTRVEHPEAHSITTRIEHLYVYPTPGQVWQYEIGGTTVAGTISRIEGNAQIGYTLYDKDGNVLQEISFGVPTIATYEKIETWTEVTYAES